LFRQPFYQHFTNVHQWKIFNIKERAGQLLLGCNSGNCVPEKIDRLYYKIFFGGDGEGRRERFGEQANWEDQVVLKFKTAQAHTLSVPMLRYTCFEF